MASNINPNNIDVTYPIAGQDNDSQGFRDNFTNIKTNFTYAETEIEDLQSKAILKSALTGGSLDNDMAGSVLQSATLKDTRLTRVALGSVTGGTATIDYSAGHYHTFTLGANTTLAFTNFPGLATATASYVRVQVATDAGNSYTLTFPSAVSVNDAGILGHDGTDTITFPAAGTYEFEFVTNDGGSTITVNEVNKGLAPFANTSEDLADAAAANLAVTTSYFSTAASETATLAAGTEGQIKVFAMYADSGNMEITVTNAGWKSSGTGTVTFDTIGQSCTLMYINSKWVAIGNNGATFA